MSVTPRQAATLVRNYLTEAGVPFTKVSGKTVDFTDLARFSYVLVEIRGWTEWTEDVPRHMKALRHMAKEHDFLIADGGFVLRVN